MGRKSDMQERIYDVIVRFVRKNGYAPSVREIGEAVGLKSPSTVHFHLKKLEEQGLITLKEGADLNATKNDIAENPKNLDILEIEAAQIPRSLQDVDIAVINGNYAIAAGLKVADALAAETADSLAAVTYQNVIAVREEDAEKDSIKALVEVLKSDEIKDFINETYQGAVVPVE